MKLIENITIGADIECFAVNKDGKFITAEGVVKGTKDKPFFFSDPKEYFTTQLDCVAAEFTIPPVTSKTKFLGNIMKSKNYLKEALAKKDLSTAFVPAARFTEDQLVTETSREFGCDPDSCAWRDAETNRIIDAQESNLRTAGFHVHIGYDKPDNMTSMELMKFFDTFVTLPALLIEPDNERREIYGKAGAFRIKPYGMEARTLSSYFASTKKLLEWVYTQTNEAIDAMNEYYTVEENLGNAVEKAINNGDKEAAKEICKKLNINTTIAA